jgi:hypothetical protein
MQGGGHDQMPGWYPDPADTELERFWDGDEWTQKSRQAPLLKMPPPVKPPPGRRSTGEPMSGADGAGYIFAVLVPVIGLVIGLTQINQSVHGPRVVLLSVGMFLFYMLLLVTHTI